tara:strand:- start:1336 stop:1875 length:540 start_codon:yes stop_codon:yes gene_type:complete
MYTPQEGDIVIWTSDYETNRVLTVSEVFFEDRDDEYTQYVLTDDSGSSVATVTAEDVKLVRSEADIRASILEKDELVINQETHTVTIMSFDGALQREVKRIKNTMKQIDSLNGFDIRIKAEGTFDDDSFKITYEVDSTSYNTSSVEGNSMQECVDEFMRRHGWDEMHKVKQIADNSIPV